VFKSFHRRYECLRDSQPLGRCVHELADERRGGGAAG
jgi:hypothetical protein